MHTIISASTVNGSLGCFIALYGGNKQTMPAWRTNGVYTTQTNGANQTPRTSQFHTAAFSSSPPKTSHPAPRSTYRAYRANPAALLLDGVERESGAPSRTASVAAREKFRRDVTDMTAEARQRLSDFTSPDTGARSGVEPSIVKVAMTGNAAQMARAVFVVSFG